MRVTSLPNEDSNGGILVYGGLLFRYSCSIGTPASLQSLSSLVSLLQSLHGHSLVFQFFDDLQKLLEGSDVIATSRSSVSDFSV